jgi:dipeptidyl aminopeptidase/acylaminoacyl peptidase
MVKAIPAAALVAAGLALSANGGRDGVEAQAGLQAPAALQIPVDAEGPPRTITAGDLVGLRDIETFTVSPDGKQLAFLLKRANAAANRYDIGWFVVPVAGGDPIYVGDGGEPQFWTLENGDRNGDLHFEAGRWSPDAQWIAYLVSEGGRVQLWRSRADGRVREELTQLDADVRSFRWSAAGDRLYVTSWKMPRTEAAAALEAEGRRGFLLDDRFFPQHSLRPFYRASVPDDYAAAYRGARARPQAAIDDDSALWVVELEPRRLRPATPTETTQLGRMFMTDSSVDAHVTAVRLSSGDASHIAVSRDGGSVAWLEPIDASDPSAFRALRIASTEIDGSDAVRCVATSCQGRLSELLWNGDAELVYFRRFGTADRHRALEAWDPASGHLRTILKTQDVVEQCQASAAGLVCLHESLTTPRRLVSIDLTSGALATIVDPNPEFRRIRFGEIDYLDLTNRYGHDAFGHVLKPPGFTPDRRYPVVVTTYRSSGFLRGGVGDEYPPHLLAANGFVVLSYDKPDVIKYTTAEAMRGDSGCPSCAFSWLRHESADASLELGLAEIERRGWMDRERVAVTGLSAGASIVFNALIYSPLPLAAAIASYAPGDPITVYIGHRPWRETHMQLHGGLPHEGGSAYLERVSPAFNADSIRAPVLLHISDRELLMSMQTIATLEHKKKPVETHVFPDEYHVKWQPAHRDAIYRRNLQWLLFWLKGEEAADPVDPDQYVRWRAMRVRQCELFKGDDAPWYCRQ